MAVAEHRVDEIKRCLQHYGVQARSIEWLAHGTFAEVYKVDSDIGRLVVRIRAPEAQPKDVLFARRWAIAVSAEIDVPTPLEPDTDVPTIENRCVEVSPYIESTGYNDAGPEAWITIGRWLGCMHRLARKVEEDSPVALDYGNHPHEQLFNRYLEQSRIGCVDDVHRQLMVRVDAAVQRIRQAVAPFVEALPVGVVHGDMHFWNVLYRDDQPVAVIDLDFLQRGVLLHDLAYASHWLTEWSKRGGPWGNITTDYLAAYEQGRDSRLAEEERLCLPWLLALSGVFFFVSKARLSWNRLAHDRHDLEQAEDLIQSLLEKEGQN